MKKASVQTPMDTRYFYRQTGFGMKQGEGFYQNINLNTHLFTYGLYNDLNVEIGVIPISLVAESPVARIQLMKQIHLDDVLQMNAGISATVLEVPWQSGWVPGAHASITYGTKENNINLGVSAVYYESRNIKRSVYGEDILYPLTMGAKWTINDRHSISVEAYTTRYIEEIRDIARRGGNRDLLREHHFALINVNRRNRRNVFSAGVMYYFDNRNYRVFGLLLPTLTIKVPVS